MPLRVHWTFNGAVPKLPVAAKRREAPSATVRFSGEVRMTGTASLRLSRSTAV